MRISLLTFPYVDYPSGGMMVLYEYANRLAQRGHEVQLIQGWPPAGQRFKWPVSGPAEPPPAYWFAHDPRVIMRHVPSLSEAEIPPADILLKGLPLIPLLPRDRGTAVSLIQGAGVFPSEVEQAEFSAPLSKICISKWLCELVRQAGTQEESIAYVPNGIDHSIFGITRAVESRSPCVAMLLHPLPIKGSDVGLAALELVRARFPTLRAILFGAWAPQRVLPDWVEYVESPSREQLATAVYNQASLFLSPSYLEGFSLCSLEAMACGCALVCTDVPGMRDYAEHETTALVSRVGDATALAANLCRLIEDEAHRCALAEAGRRRSLQFDWDRSSELLEKHLIRFRDADLAR